MRPQIGSSQFELPLPIASSCHSNVLSSLVSTGSDVQFRLPLALPRSTIHSLCIANNTLRSVHDRPLESFTALLRRRPQHHTRARCADTPRPISGLDSRATITFPIAFDNKQNPRNMFAHCKGDLWRSDDFSRCFRQEYVPSRIRACEEIWLIIVVHLQLPADYISTNRVRRFVNILNHTRHCGCETVAATDCVRYTKR